MRPASSSSDVPAHVSAHVRPLTVAASVTAPSTCTEYGRTAGLQTHGSATRDGEGIAGRASRVGREGVTMGILAWIFFGLIVGIIAKLLMPGRDPGGFIVTVLLGIAGALLGGFIGRAMGFYGPDQSAGWLMSIGGAIVLLALYRVLVGRRV